MERVGIFGSLMGAKVEDSSTNPADIPHFAPCHMPKCSLRAPCPLLSGQVPAPSGGGTVTFVFVFVVEHFHQNLVLIRVPDTGL